MQVTKDGMPWGEIQVEQTEQQVQFHAVGTLTEYGEILRIWGMRKDAQPLLIGVAEPDGKGLKAERVMSRQYLASLGYKELPEYYIAGTKPPVKQACDSLIEQAMALDSICVRQENDVYDLSCPFTGDTAFPLAFAFCCCTVKDGVATLLWDKQKDCPVQTAHQVI